MNVLAGTRTIEVKVRRPLFPANADWSVTDKDGTLEMLVEPTKEMKKAMGAEARMYARVAIDNGTVTFIERINRGW